MAEKEKEEKHGISFKAILFTLLFILIACAASGAGVAIYVKQKPEILGLSVDTSLIKQKEQEKLIEELSKILDLPSDEEPQITTISDIHEFESEDSIKNIKEGDIKIEYAKAGETIIYRLQDKKLIGILYKNTIPSKDVPLEVASPSSTIQTQKFALYNGTETVGATKWAEAAIKEKYSDSEITARAVAQRTDYPETIIVDLTGVRGTEAEKIASDLGIAAGLLPEGEKRPETADFLIIVGADKL